MTLEHLKEQKEEYLNKQNYFKNIGFDNFAAMCGNVVSLIEEMEEYIKEKDNVD